MKRRRGGCLRYFLILAVFGCVMMLFPALKVMRDGQEAEKETSAGLQEEIPYQDILIENDSLTGKYYYGLLEEEEQRVYKEIVQGLMDGAEEIYVHCGEPDLANRMLKVALKDDPEIFWCDGEVSSTSYEGGGASEAYTVVTPVYNCGQEERQRRQEVIGEAVEEALGGISADATDYEKIQYVYEYLVNTVAYDPEAPENQNIYSVFGGNRSVCAGYAKAVQYLLEKLGISVIYVTGTANGQNAHAWNIVNCGGAWYHLDATWGDPVYQTAEREEVPDWETISYDYMCCNDAEVSRTHTADAEYPLPECTDMEWNYYVVNGMYYESYHPEDALEELNQAIYEQRNPTVFKYADGALYQQAREDILGNLVQQAAQNLCELYGKEEVSYYYQEQPELRKLAIYWQY